MTMVSIISISHTKPNPKTNLGTINPMALCAPLRLRKQNYDSE